MQRNAKKLRQIQLLKQRKWNADKLETKRNEKLQTKEMREVITEKPKIKDREIALKKHEKSDRSLENEYIERWETHERERKDGTRKRLYYILRTEGKWPKK
jgi:hypothetical protein